jgi:hypothetical protein
MSNAEAINQALVAANAARLEGFENTQKALLDIARTLQQLDHKEVDATLVAS